MAEKFLVLVQGKTRHDSSNEQVQKLQEETQVGAFHGARSGKILVLESICLKALKQIQENTEGGKNSKAATAAKQIEKAQKALKQVETYLTGNIFQISDADILEPLWKEASSKLSADLS